jgi:hypothetical protein
VASGLDVASSDSPDHAVLFYRNDEELAERAGGHLAEALRVGGSAIAVCTPEHRLSFEQRLSDRAIDVAAASSQGRYVALDADEAGLVSAAVELEALWNELLGQHSCSLLCAYPVPLVSDGEHVDALDEVCRLHADVVGGQPEPGEPLSRGR